MLGVAITPISRNDLADLSPLSPTGAGWIAMDVRAARHAERSTRRCKTAGDTTKSPTETRRMRVHGRAFRRALAPGAGVSTALRFASEKTLNRTKPSLEGSDDRSPLRRLRSNAGLLNSSHSAGEPAFASAGDKKTGRRCYDGSVDRPRNVLRWICPNDAQSIAGECACSRQRNFNDPNSSPPVGAGPNRSSSPRCPGAQHSLWCLPRTTRPVVATAIERVSRP